MIKNVNNRKKFNCLSSTNLNNKFIFLRLIIKNYRNVLEKISYQIFLSRRIKSDFLVQIIFKELGF